MVVARWLSGERPTYETMSQHLSAQEMFGRLPNFTTFHQHDSE